MFYKPLSPTQLPSLFAGLKIVEAIALQQENVPTEEWVVKLCVENEYNGMTVLFHPDKQVQRMLREAVAHMSLGVTILRCADHEGVHVWSADKIADRSD